MIATSECEEAFLYFDPCGSHHLTLAAPQGGEVLIALATIPKQATRQHTSVAMVQLPIFCLFWVAPAD
jgi:hypothetical protein